MLTINIHELRIKHVSLCNLTERTLLSPSGIFDAIEMIDKNFTNSRM